MARLRAPGGCPWDREQSFDTIKPYTLEEAYEVLEAIDLKSEGSLIDAELIVKAKNRGFRIQQIGLDYFPRIRGQSHLSSPKVILKIFAERIKLYPEMRRRTQRPPRKIPTVSDIREAPHRHRR